MAKFERPFLVGVAKRRGAAPLGGLWLLLFALLSCGDKGPAAGDGPLVRLRVSPVDATAVSASVDVTAQDPAGQSQSRHFEYTTSPFDTFGVVFPAGTRGATTYVVHLYQGASCLSAIGRATLTLDGDGTFDLPVTMTPVPLCGNAVKLDVQVANIIGGSGTVTSNPPGISCQGPGGNGCSAVFMAGTNVTLTATASTGTFAGWSGGTCSGLGACMFTTAQDIQLQAVFTACHGWCPEPLPFVVTANLNAISGTAANNVVVVGDSATALEWDGLSWKRLVPPSSATVSLRAAAGRLGGSTVNVAGDGGTILQRSGGNWRPITNPSTENLRAATIGLGGTPYTYFAGDNGAALVLANNGSSVSLRNVQTTVALYGLSENPNGAKDDVYVVGAVSGGRGFAETWDGNNSVTAQMIPPGQSIAGNIYAALGGSAYHYAAGDGGMIIRRSSTAGNSGNWMLATTPTTQTLRGLWSSADNNIYAVGDVGTIVRFDGAAWSTMNSGSTTNLRAIWGTSSTNIYAVGDSGTILHYLP